MYLDRCVVCCESDLDDYFELHEITSKDTYILKVSLKEFNIGIHVIIISILTSHESRCDIWFGMFPACYYSQSIAGRITNRWNKIVNKREHRNIVLFYQNVYFLTSVYVCAYSVLKKIYSRNSRHLIHNIKIILNSVFYYTILNSLMSD